MFPDIRLQARAKDIMTPSPMTVAMDTSCEQLMSLFVTNRISAAPVVDESGNLKGLITVEDIIKFKVEIPYLPTIADTQRGFVSDHMSRNICVANPDTQLGELSSLMLERSSHHAVIVEPNSRVPVGIVSSFDFLRLFTAF